jgi:hypothetical protein
MNRRAASKIPKYAVLSGCFLLAGCSSPPIKPVLNDPDPSVNIPAIELAVKNHDRSAIPLLIQNLDNDDPAVRFYANDALKKLTSLDFDFLYYQDEDTRRAAVERWKQWYAGQTAPAVSGPASSPVPASQP